MPKKPKKTPGPEAERLAVDDDWKSAVRRALAKGKPPKEEKRPKKKRGSSK